MKKKDIINKYAEINNCTKKDAATAIDNIIHIIKMGIIEDGVVDITGFAKFEVSSVPARERVYITGANKGEKYISPAHKTLKTKFKSVMKELVNEYAN